MRAHSLSGAVAIPGLYPQTQAVSNISGDKAIFGSEGGAEIAVSNTEVQLASRTATQFIARADRVLNELTAMVNVFNGHSHPATMGTTSPTTTPMTAPNLPACDQVKGV